MSVPLSELVATLQADVPALNGVPSAQQYERAVKDAVAQFSRRASMLKVTTLSVVSGTGTYDLPADFLKLVKLSPLASGSGVIVSSEGLIPLATSYKERALVAGLKVTFDPTPTYTLDRKLLYKAGYVLNEDADPAYDDMTEEIAGIVMLRAQVLALGLQVNSVAPGAWSYSIGDESFRKENQATALQKRASDLQEQYDAAVKIYIGTHTQQAEYSTSEYGSFAPDGVSPFLR